MTTSDHFTVDPDELDSLVRDMTRTERALEALTNDVERQIAALHETWEGSLPKPSARRRRSGRRV